MHVSVLSVEKLGSTEKFCPNCGFDLSLTPQGSAAASTPPLCRTQQTQPRAQPRSRCLPKRPRAFPQGCDVGLRYARRCASRPSCRSSSSLARGDYSVALADARMGRRCSYFSPLAPPCFPCFVVVVLPRWYSAQLPPHLPFRDMSIGSHAP